MLPLCPLRRIMDLSLICIYKYIFILGRVCHPDRVSKFLYIVVENILFVLYSLCPEAVELQKTFSEEEAAYDVGEPMDSREKSCRYHEYRESP